MSVSPTHRLSSACPPNTARAMLYAGNPNEEDADDTALHTSGERLNELLLSQSPGCQRSEVTPSKDCLTPTDELQSEVPQEVPKKSTKSRAAASVPEVPRMAPDAKDAPPAAPGRVPGKRKEAPADETGPRKTTRQPIHAPPTELQPEESQVSGKASAKAPPAAPKKACAGAGMMDDPPAECVKPARRSLPKPVAPWLPTPVAPGQPGKTDAAKVPYKARPKEKQVCQVSQESQVSSGKASAKAPSAAPKKASAPIPASAGAGMKDPPECVKPAGASSGKTSSPAAPPVPSEASEATKAPAASAGTVQQQEEAEVQSLGDLGSRRTAFGRQMPKSEPELGEMKHLLLLFHTYKEAKEMVTKKKPSTFERQFWNYMKLIKASWLRKHINAEPMTLKEEWDLAAKEWAAQDDAATISYIAKARQELEETEDDKKGMKRPRGPEPEDILDTEIPQHEDIMEVVEVEDDASLPLSVADAMNKYPFWSHNKCGERMLRFLEHAMYLTDSHKEAIANSICKGKKSVTIRPHVSDGPKIQILPGPWKHTVVW
jgi:hypothetical protein